MLFVIPKNFHTPEKIFGVFKKRNVAEAVIVAFAILPAILVLVPAEFSTRLVLAIIFGGGPIMIFASGIGDRSVTEYIGNVIVFLIRRRKLKFRRTSLYVKKTAQLKKKAIRAAQYAATTNKSKAKKTAPKNAGLYKANKKGKA